MNDSEQDCLTERHIFLFGSTVHWFAQYEVLVQKVMARLAGNDLACITVLTRTLDFSEKRLALLDLLHVKAVPSDQWERVYAYLAVPHGLVSLRNDIAHANWVNSPLPNSIQPNWILRQAQAIETLREGRGSSDDTSYTLDDLSQVVHNLAGNYESFSAYLLQVGLVAR
jgi:hypothetical protein